MDWQEYFNNARFREESFAPISWLTDLVGITHHQSNIANIDQNVGTMLFNSQEAEKNRVFQERMWNMNNEYNSPAAQMQRAREAGLNPGLLYGQPISEAQAPAGSEASAGAGHGVIPNEDIARMLGQWSLIPEQKALLDAQKQEILSRIPLNQTKVDLNNASIQDIASKIQQRLHQNALTDAERENISFDQMYKNYQIDLSYRRLENETNLTNAQVENLEATTRKALAEAKVSEREFYEMCYTFAIRAAGLEAQVGLTKAQTDQAHATAAKLGVDQQAIEQGIRMNTPEEMYQNSATDDLTGKNGVANMIARQAIMAGSKVVRALGGAVHLNYKMN